MDKDQALYHLWSGFGLPAYDETSVPDNTEYPYITYSTSISSLGNPVTLNASIWYRSNSWVDASRKAEEIAEYIGIHRVIPLDTGYLYIVQGSPFAQRMGDDTDERIRRIIINLQAEYLTAY